MAENKTKPTNSDAFDFLNSLEDERKKADALALVELMRDVTGEPPVMWGANMVGFGRYHYKYATGREGESFLAGFAPRKDNITLYIMAGFDDYQPLLEKLGKYKTGKSCLYVKRLSDVDTLVLKDLVAQSVAHMKATNPDPQ